MMMKQSEAVYQAMMNVGDLIEDVNGAVKPTPEQRAQVNAILFEGFRAGKIELTKEYDDKELRSYVSGLQSNWLRKDKRLNGGVKYEAKNPGSRSGSGDESVKAMRALLSTMTDAASRTEIQGFIDARVAALKPAAAATLDINSLPPELIAKYIKGRE
jgi:hypothetical protein